MDNMWLEIGAYTAMFFSIVFIVTLSFNECFRDSSKRFIFFNPSVKQELELCFDKLNQSLASRGINWSVIDGHYWLECKIVREFDPMRTAPVTQNYLTGLTEHLKETEEAQLYTEQGLIKG